MTKQAINYLLGQMERLGYLTREDDPEDQRSKRIHLTDRGHAAARTIREIVRELETEWEQKIGPHRLVQLRELMTQLQPQPPPSPPSITQELIKLSPPPRAALEPDHRRWIDIPLDPRTRNSHNTHHDLLALGGNHEEVSRQTARIRTSNQRGGADAQRRWGDVGGRGERGGVGAGRGRGGAGDRRDQQGTREGRGHGAGDQPRIRGRTTPVAEAQRRSLSF
jgi:Winged helix DNA-binding domain